MDLTEHCVLCEMARLSLSPPAFVIAKRPLPASAVPELELRCYFNYLYIGSSGKLFNLRVPVSVHENNYM